MHVPPLRDAIVSVRGGPESAGLAAFAFAFADGASYAVYFDAPSRASSSVIPKYVANAS